MTFSIFRLLKTLLRVRCSPLSQVFALATCGSSGSLQYGQLLVSLASLHAVSMVDVMLNSRFYHARYVARYGSNIGELFVDIISTCVRAVLLAVSSSAYMSSSYQPINYYRFYLLFCKSGSCAEVNNLFEYQQVSVSLVSHIHHHTSVLDVSPLLHM